MSAKNKPVLLGSMLSVQDILGWYDDNYLPPSKAQLAFPLVQSDSKTWKTLANASLLLNEAADTVAIFKGNDDNYLKQFEL